MQPQVTLEVCEISGRSQATIERDLSCPRRWQTENDAVPGHASGGRYCSINKQHHRQTSPPNQQIKPVTRGLRGWCDPLKVVHLL
jgi:hypothetical protein